MPNKPKLNATLLKRIVQHLREEPKRYNQAQWGKQVDPTLTYAAPACGTQGCIAGWAVLLDVPRELWQYLFDGGAFTPDGSINSFGMTFAPITPVAQKLLGLTDQEAQLLFTPDNQGYTSGEQGVKEAAAKINLLIRDRAKFVERYA